MAQRRKGGVEVGGEQQGGGDFVPLFKTNTIFYLFVHLIVDIAQNSWTNGDND